MNTDYSKKQSLELLDSLEKLFVFFKTTVAGRGKHVLGISFKIPGQNFSAMKMCTHSNLTTLLGTERFSENQRLLDSSSASDSLSPVYFQSLYQTSFS